MNRYGFVFARLAYRVSILSIKVLHPRNLPTEEAKGANMIKLTRDGFGTLTLYVTFKGKRHIFKHWKYQGWYNPEKESEEK